MYVYISCLLYTYIDIFITIIVFLFSKKQAVKRTPPYRIHIVECGGGQTVRGSDANSIENLLAFFIWT